MKSSDPMRDLALRKLALHLAQAARAFASGRNRGVHGGALVEFAVTGPALVLMMVCAGDLGLGIYRHMQVQNAAQLGAQYAVAHGFDATAISAAVSAASSFPLSASPAPSQYRSEERRVGKECRYRWSTYHLKKKEEKVTT